MAIVTHLSLKSLISKVVEYAKTQLPDQKQYALFSQFVSLFYSHASLNDLKDRPISELFGMVHSHWLLVCCQPKKSQAQVRAFNPDVEQDGWRATHTVVELIMKDMPFIVDSMRMEMNRLGFTVHLMIYMGGMKVCRDENGFATNNQSGAKIESPVYMEIDRQTDPAILSMIEENLNRVLKDVQIVVQDWVPIQQRVQESI